MFMPNHKIIHNVDNESSNDIAELKNKLLNQLTNPVRWSYAMEYIKKHNGIVIECGPNNVLSGLARSNGIDEVYSTFSKNFIDEIKSAL
jgi:[acyl-carrier-protein] S-malonyltransferase